MLPSEVRRRIDAAWDAVWSSGVTNPLTALEYLSTLLLLKRLQERKGTAGMIPVTLSKAISTGDTEAIARFMGEIGSQFGIGASPDIAAASTWRDTETLRQVIDSFLSLDLSDRNQDILGDVFEYMLNHLSTAGQFGQFRTPRHVVRLMVDALDPKPGEVVLDPACGTGGFLVASHEHRDGHNENYVGEEFDATIHRICSTNCQLHGMDGATIRHVDALQSRSAEADVILANPPFAGTVVADRVASYESRTLKTELLFVESMMNRLKPGGRAASIVPNGVITSTGASAIWVRRQLLESNRLQAVIELPNGVFRPYTDVRTAILIWSNESPTGKVVVMKVERDGFSLDDRRIPDGEGDFENVLGLLRSPSTENPLPHALVTSEEVASHQYVLSPSRYIAHARTREPREGLTLDEALLRAKQKFLRIQSALEHIEAAL